ncbi:SAP domain-containing ribonucleoprotein [Ostrinia nubilalis]|uniref:SAP domain-containing ribonucleoprotein n=1 Tax=Ostrinia nubilalis TaxID=29057 RepID=UPI0030822443
MADSTVTDVSKMKVVDLRKELKSRGLSYAGDKSELVARLQAAMSQDDHGDINLDSDEIDSDGVLEDEDDKSQTDILDDSAVDTINEELALADNPPPVKSAPETKHRVLKRKITLSETDKDKSADKDSGSKKIVLNRSTSTQPKPVVEEPTQNKPLDDNKPSESNKIRITAEIDPKTRLEMRAKRFGLPVKMSEAERKEARKQRFGQGTGTATTGVLSTGTTGSLSENIDKLKKRAERFGQSVSKIMTDIENKERLEKRKEKFGKVK